MIHEIRFKSVESPSGRHTAWGRNGGILISGVAITEYDHTGDLDISPITSKGKISDACRIDLEKESIPELIATLQKLGPEPNPAFDFKLAAVKLAQAIIAADQDKRCNSCQKEDWYQPHDEGCPVQMASVIIAESNGLPEVSEDDEEHRLNVIHLARTQAAREGSAEIDDDAVVSEGDENGAYVQAWLWVDFAGTDLSKE